MVAQALTDRGLSAGRLGVEETTKFVWADSIAAAAPQLKVVSATPVIAGCRMIKDAHELELMQLASTATLKVYAAVHEALRPGMTQVDVERLIAMGYRQVGFQGEASVQVGEYTALPHGSMAPQTIREGTIMMIDDGCTVEGYQSDITRTFVLGKATDAMHRVFDVGQARAGRRAGGGAAGCGARRDRCGGAAGRRPKPATVPDTHTSAIGWAMASAWTCTNGRTWWRTTCSGGIAR